MTVDLVGFFRVRFLTHVGRQGFEVSGLFGDCLVTVCVTSVKWSHSNVEGGSAMQCAEGQQYTHRSAGHKDGGRKQFHTKG